MSSNETRVRLFVQDAFAEDTVLTQSQRATWVGNVWDRIFEIAIVAALFAASTSVDSINLLLFGIFLTVLFLSGVVIKLSVKQSRTNFSPGSRFGNLRSQPTTGILLALTDPVNAHRLRGQLEIRRFMEIFSGDKRRQLDPCVVTSCRPADLMERMREQKPEFVQISGHGSPSGILFEGDSGEGREMGGQELVHMFHSASRKGLRVVILNSCHSSFQAKCLAKIIGCTIGIQGEISDEDGISFTSTLWSALRDNSTVQGACAIAAAGIGVGCEIIQI